jgi:hypothetical protein
MDEFNLYFLKCFTLLHDAFIAQSQLEYASTLRVTLPTSYAGNFPRARGCRLTLVD